jgi:hypothetical protein
VTTQQLQVPPDRASRAMMGGAAFGFLMCLQLAVSVLATLELGVLPEDELRQGRRGRNAALVVMYTTLSLDFSNSSMVALSSAPRSPRAVTAQGLSRAQATASQSEPERKRFEEAAW